MRMENRIPTVVRNERLRQVVRTPHPSLSPSEGERVAEGRVRGRRTTMTCRATLLLVLATLSLATVSAAELNFTNALATAQQTRRPVLVHFTAGWCPPCQMMERTTFKDEAVLKTLDQFPHAKLDLDTKPELAKRFSVSGIPAFIMLNPDGDEVARSTGYMDARRFGEWLVSGMLASSRSMAQKEIFQQQQAALVKTLQGGDDAHRQGAVATLLEFAARREKEPQQFAAEQLKLLAAREPALLVDGLNHPQLAARILVANLLREKLGDEFKFDPWEKPDAREKAQDEVRRQVSAVAQKQR